VKGAFIIVAVILFLIDAAVTLARGPTPPAWRAGFTPLGLAFFAASFASFVPA